MDKKILLLFQSVLICFMIVSTSAVACLSGQQTQTLNEIANNTGVNNLTLVFLRCFARMTAT